MSTAFITRVSVLGGAAVIYLLYKQYRNMRTRSGTGRLLDQLKADPTQGEAFAETLNVLIDKRNAGDSNADNRLSEYLEGRVNRLGSFLIGHIQRLDNGNYLFVTTSGYQESFSAGVRVQATDLHNLNFILKKDDGKNQYQVYSDGYVELIDKNLRTDFAFALLDFLQKG